MKIKLIILTTLALLLGACSVKYSFTGASISPDTKTFSISEFENVASIVEPTLAGTIVEALKDKFISETSLRMSRTNPDILIEGRITGYDVSPQSVQSDETSALNRLTISVEITFTNQKEPLRDFKKTFSRYVDFSSEINFDDVQSEKIELITEQLVDDIFLKALADW